MILLEDFFRFRNLGIKLLNSQTSNFIQQNPSISDLLRLFFFPSSKIHKKSIKALRIHPSGKFRSISNSNWQRFIPEKIKDEAAWFTIFFLIDHSFSFYYRSYKKIKKNRTYFETFLLQGLIHPEEVIQKHCVHLLHELFPQKYPQEDINDILTKITGKKLKNLLQTLQGRLEKPNLPWYEKEDIISKLGAFPPKIALQMIKKFVNDSDMNVRLAVARTLRNLPHYDTFSCLFSLLMDSNREVRETALESLKFLNPNYFGKKTALNILEEVEDEELLTSYAMAFKPINLERLWDKKILASEIILNYSKANPQVLIRTLIKFLNEENSTNNSDLNEYLQEKKRQDTLEKLIISHGYSMMQYIEKFLQLQEFKPYSVYLQKLRDKIQSHYTVIQTSGWKILL